MHFQTGKKGSPKVVSMRSATSEGSRVWTVAMLGAFSPKHRLEPLAHAVQGLKDSLGEEGFKKVN
jgi:hypothetical protein